MNRVGILTDAKSLCSRLLQQYPSDQSIFSVITQIEYLLDLEEGRRNDAERLKDTIIAILTTREIEQLDKAVANRLYDVCEEVEEMKREWAARGYNFR